MFLDRHQVAALRLRYPVGSRIQLIEMENDPQPIEPGTIGTVRYVDDAGQLVMACDCGRSLSLIPGVDRFIVLSYPKEVTA